MRAAFRGCLPFAVVLNSKMSHATIYVSVCISLFGYLSTAERQGQRLPTAYFGTDGEQWAFFLYAQ